MFYVKYKVVSCKIMDSDNHLVKLSFQERKRGGSGNNQDKFYAISCHMPYLNHTDFPR